MKSFFSLVILVLFLDRSEAAKIKAKAVLFGNEDFTQPGAKGKVVGTIEFEQENDGPVTIKGQLNIPTGLHGFHIHELGDFSTNCHAAKAHFDPEHKEHGGPGDAVRHVGDLGNVKSENGVAKIDTTDSVIKLIGPHSIIGRTVDVHENVDDLGKGGAPNSKSTGNAGGRIACGIIGIMSDDYVPEENEVVVDTKIEAKAVIFDFQDFSKPGTQAKVLGILDFEQENNQFVTVKGKLDIPTGLHGFHVHKSGDYPGKGHYNPTNKNHGDRNVTDRHVGDLGNLKSVNNVAEVSISDRMIKLIGPHSIIGRSIIVHTGEDDLGKGGFADSKTSGHAGVRIGCGIIGVSSDNYNPSPSSESHRHVMNSVLGAFCIVLVAFFVNY